MPRPDRTLDEQRRAPTGLLYRPKVLVVDDDLQLAQTLRRVLAKAHEVTVTTDAEEAVGLVAKHVFDVVVSDVMMPRMSGVDFLRHLRSRDLHVPVILLTGDPTVETTLAAMRLGALETLAKPISSVELIEAVRRAVSSNRLPDSSKEPRSRRPT